MNNRCLALVLVITLISRPLTSEEKVTPPLTSAKVSTLMKQYMAEHDDTKKAALLAQAEGNPADPVMLAKIVMADGSFTGKPGFSSALTLPLPATVSATPATYALMVPGKYVANKLWPLLIGLHGGGGGTGSGSEHISSLSDTSDAIVACPTSLDLGNDFYWRNPKNEAMLISLIKDLEKRFPIDPDRIYLSGYSMGGIGTYYLAPRLCEHFAAVAPGGGAWSSVYWRQLLNTPCYVWHGRNDLRGPDFTDFPNAVNAGECLKEAGCPYELRIMECSHPDVPHDEETRMVKWLLGKKRDAYPKHIVHASPCAKDFSVPVGPSPPDRWLTIDTIGSGNQDMDGISRGGVTRSKTSLPMGILDATWTGPNVLEVKATNVKTFRVFLSPKLVDFKKPLRIMVNGNPMFDGPVASSLSFAMRYVDEHRDIGMVYVGEVKIDVDAAPVKKLD